jgi:hypothetical protein
MLRLEEHFVHWARFHHVPCIQHRHPLARLSHDGEIMGNHQDRHTLGFPQPAKQI